ncbi:DSC E3 ubiquitin ligase complex subunit 3 [Colletotrichum truncatum]|uniref:DSC E3 ubiquitin ligase complex subunit 3 n=1 Tax=Colletotrichum truncatum TaxID=5467 RepID=A0ACC3ZBX4_COLTU|nr:DSC E3 ubiquitin ligase complex subunit 3 [Colletotrichum truncatum]KAF6783807.1 DSC E3 ubiquitin ligase complex subunit 3 [Colletotrichum truncatum]
MSTSRPWTPPLLLRIRFTTSLPDLDLDIPSPSQTTVAALKHLIRSRLSQPDSQRRLRFIHQGKILPDGSALSSVLRPLPPPPSSTSTPTTPSFPVGLEDPKGKGKAKAHDAAPPRVYVNCSIGDSLTDAELAAEAEAALRAPSDRATSATTSPPDGAGQRQHGESQSQPQRQTPRGFDRLLNAGFTAAEVNQLRLQFREIRAAQYTPDTMPSPDTMRSLEDSWIDSNAGGAMPGAAGAGGDGGEGGGDDAFGVMGGILDVLIEGMVVGFFWPLGCLGWLSREESMLSGRWQDFIGFGVTLSIIIGVIRAFSGDR